MLTDEEALSIRNWLWQLTGYMQAENKLELALRMIELGDRIQAKIQEEAHKALNNYGR